MSNMRKSFEAKSKLRHMADGGGIFKSMQRIGQDDVTVFTDAKNAAPGAQAYTPRAFRELPNTGITPGAVPPMPEPAKLSVKPAAVSPLPAPAAAAAPQQFRAQTPYEKAAGQAPMPVAAKLSPMPIGPQSNYMAQTGGFGPTPAPTTYQKAGGVSGNSPTPRGVGAMGFPLMTSVGYASGGEVKGPGGPTDDEVGPVMLSDGEYVLPADTVEKVGKENLDALKDATHTPVYVKQRRGLRKLVNGTETETERRRRNPQLAATSALMGDAPLPVPPPASKLVEAPVPTQSPQITSPTMTAAWRAAQTAPAGESAAGAIGRNVRGFGAAALAPVESGLRYMGGSLSALGGGVADLGAGLAGVTPAAPVAAAPRAPTVEKQAPAEVRGPDGRFPNDPGQQNKLALAEQGPAGSEALYEAYGPAGGAVNGPNSAPFTPRGLTAAQSAELEVQGVGLGAQMDPVIKQKYTALPDAPQVGSTAIPGAAGPKALGDPNGAPTAWSDVPRTYRSDTIREGTAPGEQVGLGNGIFGTSSKEGGPIDTFKGVGSAYNENSAQFGPDPNGADRARQDAIVEANLQAKPTPRGIRMPEFRSGERDINARFDKQLRAAEQRFTSPRAAGNLAKAQLQIEEARAAALNQDADNITRQQQSAMQFQSDQSRNALTERDLAQRAAQAARADETDRLGIGAQNARAAEATAAAAQFKGMELKQKEWETLVKNKQFYGDFNEFIAEDGLKKGGFGGEYTNPKELKAIAQSVNKQVQATFGAGAGENADPEAANAVLANQQLMYGSPEAAVQTQGPAIAAVAKALGRHDLGEFVGFVDSTSADRRDSADTIYRKVLDTLQGDEKALQFTAPDGTPIYVAQDALPPFATRHFTALQKMQEERKNKKKERN